ncbi:MAG: VCBS repeat-containing protein, partial [Leptospiraceae bacterium]|nr:VCBS repeat-containing protein [Leptospiraceae bacterium]
PNTLSSAGVEIADLDGDGDLDAFVVNEGAANFVYLNDGSGNFSAVAVDALTDTSKEVALADVDGDGDVDAVVANNGQNRLYRNNGDATFVIEDIGRNYISDGVAAGDLNGM